MCPCVLSRTDVTADPFASSILSFVPYSKGVIAFQKTKEGRTMTQLQAQLSLLAYQVLQGSSESSPRLQTAADEWQLSAPIGVLRMPPRVGLELLSDLLGELLPACDQVLRHSTVDLLTFKSLALHRS
jgi:hypothetical protein